MEKAIKSLPKSGSDVFARLKTALIDSYTKRGLSAEVGVLENCTIKSSEELGSHVGGYLEVAVLTPDNVLYIHPDLTRPEKFALAEAVVRFELSYAILGIHLVNPTEMDFRKATAAIRSRLTSDELRLLRTFNLNGTVYAIAEEAGPKALKEKRYDFSDSDLDSIAAGKGGVLCTIWDNEDDPDSELSDEEQNLISIAQGRGGFMPVRYADDDLDEAADNTVGPDRRDWKARAKSFLNNDLFVDFD